MAILKVLTLALSVVAVTGQKGKLGGGGKEGLGKLGGGKEGLGGKGKFGGKGKLGGGGLGDPVGPADIGGEAEAAPSAPVEGGQGCDRAKLLSVRDEFWKAAPSGPAGLGKGVKIALNNKPVASLASVPAYAQIPRSTWTQLNVQAIDTDTCQIATFRVSSQQLLSVRLRLSPDGAITEIDFLQAVQGDQFFRPTGFPAKEPAMFNTKQVATPPPTIPSVWTPAGGMFDHRAQINAATCKATSGTPRLWNRRELIYAANSYCDGLKGAPYDRCVFAGTSCPRNENGVTTTQNCGKGTGVFGFTVRGRRWVADTDTGVVLGIFYFDYGPGKNLFLHEYFKVQRGTLAYIFAPMKNIPHAEAALKTFSEER